MGIKNFRRKIKVRLILISVFLLLATTAYSLTYQIKTQVVSVTTTATKLPTTPIVGREYIRIQNVGAVTVYLGTSTVTADTAATGGLQLLPYAVWQEEYDNTVDVYGIVAATTCNVVIEEGK